MNEVTFSIKVTMNERWVNDFCSMLKYMERCGRIGHSSLVAFYSDGDGDFRPRFEIQKDFESKEGITGSALYRKPEVFWDAG